MRSLIKPETKAEDAERIYEIFCEDHTCDCKGLNADCEAQCKQEKWIVDESTNELLF